MGLFECKMQNAECKIALNSYLTGKLYPRNLCEMPSLKGNSPVRGNVCEADKRVPVSGGKGGPLAVEGSVAVDAYGDRYER